MAIDTKKISLPKAAKEADNLKIKTVGDKLIAIYENAEGEMVTKTLPGNINKEETEKIKVGEKIYKVLNGEVTEIKQGKVKDKGPNPGDAGGSTVAKLAKGGFPDLSGDVEVTQKDILMGKGVIKMKKGGIVKKKSSRTRIAKRGFGIAKRGY